jgi:hypothetical protein
MEYTHILRFFILFIFFYTHGGVHDTDAVGAYGVCDVSDVDGVEVLVVGRALHKDLVVEVVQVLGHKHVDVAHDFQNIQTLQQNTLHFKNIQKKKTTITD